MKNRKNKDLQRIVKSLINSLIYDQELVSLKKMGKNRKRKLLDEGKITLKEYLKIK